MKPLFVLILSAAMAFIIGKFIFGGIQLAKAASIGMSVMLVFTSIGHFAFTKGMVMMMPEFIPFKKNLVYLTGIFEGAAAIGLQIDSLRMTTGWLLIGFFIVLLPANIHAAMKHVDYQKADNHGNGPAYLWFRIPLQMLFIIWVYCCSILK